jgi:hypothetical protein
MKVKDICIFAVEIYSISEGRGNSTTHLKISIPLRHCSSHLTINSAKGKRGKTYHCSPRNLVAKMIQKVEENLWVILVSAAAANRKPTCAALDMAQTSPHTQLASGGKTSHSNL